MTDIPENRGLMVEVTKVVYMPNLDSTPERPFPFVYFITVRNNGPRAVTLRGRKWVVKGADGEVLVVEGDGLVGRMPRLQPGESFTYNSYHTIGVDSEAGGAFFGEDDEGQVFFTRIPEFQMQVPVP